MPGRSPSTQIDAAADLRRPGGDRDRERAPVQRDQGGARAADGDGGDPQGHRQFAVGRAAGVRRDRWKRRAPVRRSAAAVFARRRRAAASGGALEQLDSDGAATRCADEYSRSPRSQAGSSGAHRRTPAPPSISETRSDDPEYPSATRACRRLASACSAVPMLREATPIGAINRHSRRTPGTFTGPADRAARRPSPTRR